MHQTLKYLLVFAVICMPFSACVKDQNASSKSTPPALVTAAKAYFEKAVSTSSQSVNSNNYRARQPRSINWDLATVQHLSGGDAVVAPVNYAAKIFISSSLTPYRAFSLSSLTSLVIERDSLQQFHATIVTFVPDSNASAGKRTGLAFLEDWQGNSLSKPIRLVQSAEVSSKTPSNQGSKETDLSQTIQVCDEVYGYNYSADDPADTYDWSESTCTTFSFNSDIPGRSVPPADLSSIANSINLQPQTFEIAPPTSPIANIQDYFKCFTSGLAVDHTYSVQICVEQPDPGTRVPWTWTSGGPVGSISAANPTNVGHTFIAVSENDQGNITTRNVGFYPSGFVLPITPSAQGVLNDDEQHDYNISLSISVTSTQFFDILNYLSIGNNTGYYYNLNSNNCTTFVLNALAAAGIALPATQGSWPGGTGDDPGDLGQDISQMQLSSNMVRNTVSGTHPNVGNCN